MMKNFKLILLGLVGLAVFSCEKDDVEQIKVNSINLSADKNSLEVGETLTIKLEVLPAQVSDSTVTWSSSDNNIATVSNGVVTGENIGNVVIRVKANDGSDVSDSISLNVIEELKKETLSAKWMTSSSDEYESFEFNESGNYIVVKNGETKSTNHQIVLFGTYDIIDNTTIFLSDFGNLTISAINKNSINFSIELLSNPGNEVVISASKLEEMESSTKTELICRTWKMISLNGEDIAGTEWDATVLFSKAGTYFVKFSDSEYDEEGDLAHWKWSDNSETKFFYSWENPPVWDTDYIVEVIELTSNSLKILERFDEYEEDLYEFVPVDITKHASTGVNVKNITCDKKIKAGLLMK